MNSNELDELKELNKIIIKRLKFINIVDIALVIIIALFMLAIFLN